MDPVAFLRHILPPVGPYVLTVAHGKRMWNVFAATVEDLWAKEQANDATPALVVYHACASYREARHDPKGTPRPQRRLGRTKHNVALLRSLWMDLDGGPGKPYPDGAAAAAAVLAFCQAAGLPAPVLVSSGNGCHAYWPFTTALPPSEWIRYAEGLKSLAVQHKLAFDPARTADAASVLRTPGTHNRKIGVRQVKCGPLVGPYDITLFAKLLAQPIVKTTAKAREPKTLSLGAIPPHLTNRQAPRITKNAAIDDRDPVFADVISDQCAQVRALRTWRYTHAVMPEPLWYAALGVLAFCEDGDAKAHEWSAGHTAYNREQTQEKLDRARELTGPTRCTRFHGLAPAACESCPLWETISSPANAGRGVEARPVVDPAGAGQAPKVNPAKSGVNGHHALPPALAGAATPNSEGGEADPAGAGQANGFIRFPDLDPKGQKKPTCRNARVAINGLGVVCEHDTFHNKMLVGGHVIDQWAGELSDEATQMLRVVIERQFRFDPGLVNAHDAAVQECLQHAYDPVADYLDSLVWDGVPRVASWLYTYLGAEDSRLNRAIGTLTLMAAVRRVRQPGCKFDQIIVLESPEGRGKSSAIEILAGAENFSDQTILTLDDKGQQEAVQGVWLYEIADFSGMPKSDDEKVKAFASRRFDRARPAYGRARVDRPRRCIFFATTNGERYLKSQTGNRRFWPVRIGRIDLDALTRDRNQLWAEACVMEATGHSLSLPEAFWGEARNMQESRLEEDPWEMTLEAIKPKEKHATVDGRGTEYRLSTRAILDQHLQVGPEKQNMGTLKRIAFIMRKLGWHGPEVMKIGEDVARGYRKIVGYG
jgi:hypothetical protein